MIQVNEVMGGEEKSRECPNCHSKRNWKDGIRETEFGTVQRLLCRDCGFRFSAKSNIELVPSSGRQLRALSKDAKKLDSQAEIKTVCVGEKDSLIEYAWRLKKKGLGIKTIELRCYILAALQKKGANLNNPDSVETVLATEPEYSNINLRSKKYNAVKAYVSYTKTMKVFWEPIRIKYEPKQAFIPTHDELMLFLNAAGHVMGTFLQVAYDTGARCGEICRLKWTDVNTENFTISINDPEKNSRSRTIKVSEKTIIRLLALNTKYEPYIFNPSPSSIRRNFQDLRNRLAREQNNPRLKQIHLHTFRYNFAHSLIKRGKHEKEVQQKLGHKSLSSTDRYTNTVVFNELDFETARAATVEEAEKLGKEGWTKFDEIGGIHLYRRLKP
jgi:integrase